jgi:hypothetical protein
MKAEKEPECRDFAMFRLFSQAGNRIVTFILMPSFVESLVTISAIRFQSGWLI